MKWNTLEELRTEIKRTRGRIETPSGLYQKIKDDLDYKLDYGEDRVKQLKENIDEDLYIDCLSSQQFIEQQIKKKESSLSDYAGSYTHHLDKLADYILYAKYDNEEQENEDLEVKKKIRTVRNNNSTIARKKLKAAREKETKPYSPRSLRRTRSNIKELRLDTIDEDGNPEGELIEDKKIPSTYYSWTDKEINQQGRFKNSMVYWKHFSQKNNRQFPYLFEKLNESQPYSIFAFETINELSTEIHRLENEIQKMPPTSTKALQRKKDLSTVRGNYNIAVEVLRDPVILKSGIYTIEDEYSVADKANYYSTSVIRAILYNYSELHTYHQKRMGTSIWSLLFDLERAVKHIKENKICSDVQLEIVYYIMGTSDFNYEDLRGELLNTFHEDYKKTNITYHINVIIRRILEYLTQKLNKSCSSGYYR